MLYIRQNQRHKLNRWEWEGQVRRVRRVRGGRGGVGEGAADQGDTLT